MFWKVTFMKEKQIHPVQNKGGFDPTSRHMKILIFIEKLFRSLFKKI